MALSYRDGELHVDDVAAAGAGRGPRHAAVRLQPEPLRAQYRALAQAMAEVKPLICYSVKANSNGAVIRTFLDEGAGLDIVSGGELFRALRAGADPARIVFAGVGKTRDEIEYALRQGILFFTVESEPEARAHLRVRRAARDGAARIAFRVNPDVDPQTHKYISTGKKENKFGLDLRAGRRGLRRRGPRCRTSRSSGLHMHIGSQILSPEPFAEALGKVRGLCRGSEGALSRRSATWTSAAGIGIRYQPGPGAAGARAPMPRAVVPLLQGPRAAGRAWSPAASWSATPASWSAACSTSRTTPSRSSWSWTRHERPDPARRSTRPTTRSCRCAKRAGTVRGDLVGPICESGDFLALDRDLPAVGGGRPAGGAQRRAPTGSPWRRTTTAGRGRRRSWWTADGPGRPRAGNVGGPVRRRAVPARQETRGRGAKPATGRGRRCSQAPIRRL